NLAHSEPMCDGSVDVEGLARDLLLPIGLQMFQGAHVMQPVGEFDEHHADVIHHGQHHLPEILRLLFLARREVDRTDLGDAFNDVRHLFPNSLRMSTMVTEVSSTESWRRPAAMATGSIFISASTRATSSGCTRYGSPEARD